MNDLKDLLRNAAAEAENVTVDGSTLLPQIRRRRRIRSTAIGVGGAAAVTTLAVGAYAVLPGAAPASDAPVSGAQVAKVNCDPIFYPKDASRGKVWIPQTKLDRVGTNTWQGLVLATMDKRETGIAYTRLTPEPYLLTPVLDNRVVGRAESVIGPPGRYGTAVPLAFTVQGCGKQSLPAGSYAVYQSTIATEGAFAKGKPITGVKSIGILQLR